MSICLSVLLSDRRTAWLRNCLINYPTDWLADSLTALQPAWLTDRQTADRQTESTRLTEWKWTTDRPTDQPNDLIKVTYWVTGCQWLTSWLTGIILQVLVDNYLGYSPWYRTLLNLASRHQNRKQMALQDNNSYLEVSPEKQPMTIIKPY